MSETRLNHAGAHGISSTRQDGVFPFSGAATEIGSSDLSMFRRENHAAAIKNRAHRHSNAEVIGCH